MRRNLPLVLALIVLAVVVTARAVIVFRFDLWTFVLGALAMTILLRLTVFRR